MTATENIAALRRAAAAADQPTDPADLGPTILALAADLLEMDQKGTVDLDTWPAARLLILGALRRANPAGGRP